MDDFANLLQRDYGLRPQGKMAPMSAAKGSGTSSRGGGGMDSLGKSSSNGGSRSGRASTSGDDDLFFVSKSASRSSEPTYDDVFGGPPKFSAPKVSSSSIPIYDDFRAPPPPQSSSSSGKDNSFPVFDAPYDDDIFLGVRGTRPSNISYDNVFGGPSSSGSPPDDLLGGLSASQKAKTPSPETSPTYDDELLPGHSSKPAEPSSFISVDDVAVKPAEVDPFGSIQPDPFSNIPPPVDDPLESFTGYPAASNGVVGDGLDDFDIFSQPNNVKTPNNGTSTTKDFVDTSDEKPTPSTYSKHEPEDDSDGSSPRKQEQVAEEDYIPAGNFGDYSDVPARSSTQSWITIDDVKLLTMPTMMPPPSRPPPTIGYRKKENQVFEDAADTFYVDDDAAALQKQKEKEVHLMKEREERERLEREAEERERQRKERERELVERANREARERAARQARERAERITVEKALQESRMRQAAEAKQRAEEARQKAEAEAKLKAEAEAKQKAEAEAKQKADSEAQKRADAERRAQRAAVERVNAEARERAQRAAEARLKEQQQQQQQQQQRSADDLDNFFASRPSSAPRQRPPTSDFPKAPDRRTSGGSVKKVSSVSGIDELSNLFDNSEPSFREIDGETAERRKARMDRDQRSQARARQALEEKHRRDLAVQREQAEKQRASETVDYEIRRWAAGKEGNIRALLSSLQYVLWPEAGWQAVSLTDLITGAHVKKVYRKATLCIHPDKVQQKGATIQQKYIAEKVYDLLQEAWKKFNAEELF